MTKATDYEAIEDSKFSSRHPILGLLLFDAIGISICVAVSYLISGLIGMNKGLILFILAIGTLPLSLDRFNNRSAVDISRENLTSQHEVRLTSYKGSAYDMVKYMILGVALFVLSGYYGMM